MFYNTEDTNKVQALHHNLSKNRDDTLVNVSCMKVKQQDFSIRGDYYEWNPKRCLVKALLVITG